MEILKLNLENNYQLFLNFKKKINIGECYSNVLKLVLSDFLVACQLGVYDIGYCYAGVNNGQLTRHCVIVNNKENYVIDLTLLKEYPINKLKENQNSLMYYVFARLKFRDYVLALENEGQDDLQMYLTDKENEFLNYVYEHNLKVNNVDVNKYFKRLKSYKPLMKIESL